ncbi:MAG: DUF1385 domain-containing protein [Lachnospiraceae bacterium]|nr:DUF1385 domain-containing protein [Lachnospiraceae bacterium]MDY4969378.1 DUF1385 domain-containing protein [Lachnospiraceae bacterium]
MKSSGIGGQAVIEGIMMKNGDDYAVAVRKEDHSIEVLKDEYKLMTGENRFLALPFVRGVFNFIDSMVLGIKTLTWSASFFDEEEEEAKPGFVERHFSRETAEKLLMGFTVVLSICLAVGIFMALPAFLAGLLGKVVHSQFLLSALEGVVRLLLFILYVALISRMEDIRRVFMYHGAEHKCINCIEHGLELNVENVRSSSKQHKRCGTSFMLFVMLISIILFMFIHTETMWMRVLSRVLLIPVVAGISYEILRLAGNSDNFLINLISKPGLALQNMTTKEPDDEMIEVAIQAVEAVFDWDKWQKENQVKPS